MCLVVTAFNRLSAQKHVSASSDLHLNLLRQRFARASQIETKLVPKSMLPIVPLSVLSAGAAFLEVYLA